jgi:hypothetical protein
MSQDTTTEALRAFGGVEGIEVTEYEYENGHDGLVKVVDESSVGEFFKLCRSLDAEVSSVSRDHIESTVLDAWIN